MQAVRACWACLGYMGQDGPDRGAGGCFLPTMNRIGGPGGVWDGGQDGPDRVAERLFTPVLY